MRALVVVCLVVLAGCIIDNDPVRVVYAKRPFAGPAAVLAYLGRYTHRVAISNSRLIALAGDQVSFR